MSVGLLIITHGHIGEHLLEQARRTCEKLDQGDGVLVLTDMFGSTPSNIANRLLGESTIQVVAGINLPMLVRVLNYPSLNLHKMVNKALSGGHDGILLCDAEDRMGRKPVT